MESRVPFFLLQVTRPDRSPGSFKSLYFGKLIRSLVMTRNITECHDYTSHFEILSGHNSRVAIFLLPNQIVLWCCGHVVDYKKKPSNNTNFSSFSFFVSISYFYFILLIYFSFQCTLFSTSNFPRSGGLVRLSDLL